MTNEVNVRFIAGSISPLGAPSRTNPATIWASDNGVRRPLASLSSATVHQRSWSMA